jgi:hypothetical protein
LQGDITYEQAVNFYPDGTVYADVRLLETLDKRRLAALYVHESLYLHFREMFGGTDSRRTRKTVSLLFSTKTPAELITAFDWVLPLSYVSLAVPTFEKLGTYSEKVAPAQFAGR